MKYSLFMLFAVAGVIGIANAAQPIRGRSAVPIYAQPSPSVCSKVAVEICGSPLLAPAAGSYSACVASVTATCLAHLTPDTGLIE